MKRFRTGALVVCAGLLTSCGQPSKPPTVQPSAAGDEVVPSVAASVPTDADVGVPFFEPIAGFPDSTNQRLEAFFERTANYEGRKVAVFDIDGTLLNQVSHYLADECLYAYAVAHPERKPALIKKMATMSNVGHDYVEARIQYMAGMTTKEISDLGKSCFKSGSYRFYPPMLALVASLKIHGFEVWPISASPQYLYEGFVTEALGVPNDRVIAVKSVVEPGWVTTATMVVPIPQDEGKADTVYTFVGTTPLFAAGNSRGDFEMIETSSDFKLIVNPDPDKQKDLFGHKTLREYAESNGWDVVLIKDEEAPGLPNITSTVFKIKKNRSEPGPVAASVSVSAPAAVTAPEPAAATQ